MGRRLTYELVKMQFDKSGYTLLSDVYINNRSKLNYLCPLGHKGSITYADFKYGNGCSICAYRKVGEKIKKVSMK